MTMRRDPDMIAIDHAMRAMRRSTPRMLIANIEFVMFLLTKLKTRTLREPPKEG